MLRRPRRLAALAGFALTAGLVPVLAATPASAVPNDPASTVFVNELHYDNTGADAGELVEVAGPVGTDLTGWKVVLYNGGTPTAATTYYEAALSGPIGAAGVVVVEVPATPGLQNGGSDGLALVDASGAVVQLLSYEGVLTAANGPAAGQTSSDIGRAELGTEALGQSLQLTGTGGTYGAFTWTGPAAASPGALNAGQTYTAPAGPAAPRATCPTDVTTQQGTAAAAPVSAVDADSRVTDARLTSATPTAGITLEGFTASPAAGDAATATVTVATGTAAGTYPVEVVFETDASPAQSATCTVSVTVVAPGEPLTISAVQGSGATTPYAGKRVAVQAVVTSLFTRADVLDGFFLQEQAADSDGSTATSEGLFVLCRTQCPSGLAAGDVVEVQGSAGESFGMTQLDASVSTATIRTVSRGAALPTATAVALPATGSTRAAATFETVEGMLTRISSTLTVSEYFQLARTGELELTAGGRAYQYSHSNVPSVEGNAAYLADLAKRRIILDDDNNDQNDAVSGPAANEPYAYPSSDTGTVVTGLGNTPTAGARDRVRGGDTKVNLTGVLHWSFSGSGGTDAWRLRPVPKTDYTFARVNERTAAPEPVGGTLKAASFNVLNYFTTLDTTPSGSSGPCGPSGTLDCRGADSDAELVRQRTKIVEAIARIDADVLGLIEIQNDAGRSVDDLVAGINAKVGAGTYAKIDTGGIGGDAIKVAFIYKPATVGPFGAFKVLDSTIDPRFVDTANRPALIQTFDARRNGGRFTFALNHFKSKGSACAGDADVRDGAGNCNTTRTNAAAALADYLATDPTGSGDPDRLVLGDLNAYRLETPITTLQAKGYTDLINRYNGVRAYGYVFDGQLGYLDHALASESLARQATGATEWHVNADEPPLYDYNDTVLDAPGEAAFERESSGKELYAADPYRSSDHDPVVVGLNLLGPVAKPVAVQVLGINDFHGRLDIAPNLATAVKQFSAAVPNSVFSSAGDSIGASPFASAVAKDEPTIDVLNALNTRVTTVGNHEFDRGYRDLADRVVPRSAFPYLGANVAGESPDLPGSHVVETVDGVKVGFVGVVTKETASLVSPGGIEGITFGDPVAAANREAGLLTDGDTANGEADVVVLLAHEGAAISATTPEACATIGAAADTFGEIIRGASPRIDAIFGGHTHLRVDCEFPNPGGKGAVRPVLEAAEYGTALDRLNLTYDPATDRITAVTGDVVSITAAAFAPDAAVKSIVDEANARAQVLGRPVIGSITGDLTRARTATGAENRGAESTLGNFIADVQLDAVNQPDQSGAQIAFMNPGGLREDFIANRTYGVEEPGQITFGEAGAVQPFANTLFLLSLTGAQVEAVLEEQYQPDGSTRPFLALGISKGLFYRYDDTAARGSRITGITLNGVPVDPAATYRVVTNSFLATGGDNFRTLGTGTNREDTGLDDLTALVAYFGRNSPVSPEGLVPRRQPGVAAAPEPSPNSPAPSPVSPSPVSPSPSSPPATPDRCATAPRVVLGQSTITATGSSTVSVVARPGSTVDLYAYTQPSTTYRVVRSGVVDGDGSLAMSPLRPTSNTRLYAAVRGCDTPVGRGSVVLLVRTALTLDAVRTGVRRYVFSGDSIPARGQVISLYRVEASGRQVLTAQTRASATTGEWRLTRTFSGTGRFGFVVRTTADVRNAAGTSATRSVLIR